MSTPARDDTHRTSTSARPNGPAHYPGPARVAREAAQQLTELTGRQPDTVSGLQRIDDGWLVRIEVVELERIPDSTSVLASYEMEVDRHGVLRSYRRVHRYHRNQAGES